ncbi:pre-mRNA-splicing factor 38A-like [Halichondria panicea]|uniref:pre-mRNA-splicing factor 38A-like n=1 Tax=Halichondria panicea TaxID=6063 RepID=UPI00312BB9B2
MANRTAKDAKSIKGTNPQYLVEKIIRTRIYDCKYWKEDCFGLTAELLVDRALELDHIGGIFSANIKPTPFLCLILKMLQIQPSKDIIIEFIKMPDYKYVRALGAFYLRLTGDTMECYNYLEPLYNDYRKLKRMNKNGELELLHIDEFVDELLNQDRACDVILPRIQKRHILEQLEQLEPRVSALDEDLSGGESDEEEEDVRGRHSPSPTDRRHSSPSHKRRSRSPQDSKRRHSRSRSRSPRRHRSRSHSPRRHRSRSHSPRRHHSPSSDHPRRKRSHSPSPSRHRHSKHSSHKSRSDKDGHKTEKKDKEKKSKSGSKRSTEETEEIRQANELRAKLGMKPLKV